MIARSRYHARCLLVWASLTLSTVAAQVWALANLRWAVSAIEQGELATRPFEDLLVWFCSALAVGCLGWWWLTSSLIVAQAARGRIKARPQGCPESLRRWLLIGCGVAVVGAGASTPAYAEPVFDTGHPHYPFVEVDPNSRASTVGRDAIAGLPLPERIGIASGVHRELSRATRARPEVARTEPAARFVVVRPGDNLWKIAARSLVPAARNPSVGTVDAAWRHLYRLNRSRVGSDPDLIHPGMHLRLPSAREE